jgi:hypothetical protein
MKVVPFPLIEQPAIGLLRTATTSQNPDQNNLTNDKSIDDPWDTAAHTRVTRLVIQRKRRSRTTFGEFAAVGGCAPLPAR